MSRGPRPSPGALRIHNRRRATPSREPTISIAWETRARNRSAGIYRVAPLRPPAVRTSRGSCRFEVSSQGKHARNALVAERSPGPGESQEPPSSSTSRLCISSLGTGFGSAAGGQCASGVSQPSYEHRKPAHAVFRSRLHSACHHGLADGTASGEGRHSAELALRGGQVGRGRVRPDVPLPVSHARRHYSTVHGIRTATAPEQGHPPYYSFARARYRSPALRWSLGR